MTCCGTLIVPDLQECLANVLLFGNLEKGLQIRLAGDMYERHVAAGEILIQEGDAGSAAAELYIVKEGEFEVHIVLPIAYDSNSHSLCAIYFNTASLIMMNREIALSGRGWLAHSLLDSSLAGPPLVEVWITLVKNIQPPAALQSSHPPALAQSDRERASFARR